MAVRVSERGQKREPNFWDGVGGFFNDIIRNMNNTKAPSLSVPSAFVPPQYRTSRGPLQQIVGGGSNVVGQGFDRTSSRSRDEFNNMENDRRASADARRRNMNRMHQERQQEAEAQVPEGLSFLDALKQALGLVGGGEGGGGFTPINLDPQREAARARGAEYDARLAAMYRQLQGSYAADAPGIAKSYDEASAGVNKNSDQAVANINSAYNAARADQTAQLKELGIEEAAKGINERGESSTEDQAAAVSNLEQNRGAVANQLGTNKQSALDYNTEIKGAAGLEGNLQRAANQSRLQQLLADIDADEQSQNSQLQSQARSSQSSNMGMAMNLAQALQEDYYRQHPELAPQQDNWEQQQALSEFLYKQQQDQAKALTEGQGRKTSLMNNLLKQYGGDTAKAQDAFNWYVQQGLI